MATEPKIRALAAIAARMLERVPSDEGHPAPRRQIYGQVSALTEAAQALHNLHVNRDPTVTDGAHLKRVSLAASRLGRETTATINRIARITAEGRSDIAARVRVKARLAPDAYASEIRAAYRAMTPTEKTTTLRELIEQNRGPEVAAIIKAPILLTGMSEHHRQQYEAAFISKNAPDEMQEEAALQRAFDDALVSTRVAGEIAEAYSDPGKLAEITRGEAAAAAAAQAFNSKVRA